MRVCLLLWKGGGQDSAGASLNFLTHQLKARCFLMFPTIGTYCLKIFTKIDLNINKRSRRIVKNIHYIVRCRIYIENRWIITSKVKEQLHSAAFSTVKIELSCMNKPRYYTKARYMSFKYKYIKLILTWLKKKYLIINDMTFLQEKIKFLFSFAQEPFVYELFSEVYGLVLSMRFLPNLVFRKHTKFSFQSCLCTTLSH